MIRKANFDDLNSIAEIYAKIHTAEENGDVVIGWERGIYPERETAQAALERGDIFVLEEDGLILGTAVINHEQVDVYEGAGWKYDAEDGQVMVMHTLVVDPDFLGKGFGSRFVKFYEEYAHDNGSDYLRIDTNARNKVARAFYGKLGYEEIGIVPCVFNGLEGVQLVLLEKCLI